MIRTVYLLSILLPWLPLTVEISDYGVPIDLWFGENEWKKNRPSHARVEDERRDWGRGSRCSSKTGTSASPRAYAFVSRPRLVIDNSILRYGVSTESRVVCVCVCVRFADYVCRHVATSGALYTGAVTVTGTALLCSVTPMASPSLFAHAHYDTVGARARDDVTGQPDFVSCCTQWFEKKFQGLSTTTKSF